ncbi:hypothetical protein [Paenibacillus sp. ISL-20]|uniref:hypothetical protein n=1 Tax=Paenibacillus sp. ISL-20 TaxID=2819163 RepID=UPI001BEA48C2|nr:hypothetical protein [Paenibacillus sp. ISL-20]
MHKGSVAVEETWRSPLKPGNIHLISSSFLVEGSDRNGYSPPPLPTHSKQPSELPSGVHPDAAAHSRASLLKGSVAVEETWRSPLKPGNNHLIYSQVSWFQQRPERIHSPTSAHTL